MKLNCTVERSDRLLPSLCTSSKRPQISTLSIGNISMKGDARILHQTQSNKEGNIYKIKGNIMKVFTRFIQEGKATISFATPPHDLIIKSDDPLQLKSFLRILKYVLEGKQLSKGGGGLSTLDSGPSRKMPKPPKTKMSLKNKVEYPVLEGFPRTLVTLQITGIEQTRFDERILRLHGLRELDLTANHLKKLPAGLGSLPNLAVLILKENQLGSSVQQQGAWDWMRGEAVLKNLLVLDLSSNNIPVLPSLVRDIKSLATLKLDNNLLHTLPSGIGRMKALRHLSASHNQLQFLPGSMIRMRLDILDMSRNPFGAQSNITQHTSAGALSLKELSAREVIRIRIPVSEAVIPATVLRFLLGCDFCVCGSACFNPVLSRITQLETRIIAGSLILGAGESSVKPFRFSICSDSCMTCLRRFF